MHDGEKYYAGLWNLFLQSRFEAGSWTIVMSQPEEYILSALADFKSNLIRVIMIGLLLILLLSLNLIRKRLAPLDKLKERTKQIARKDFTSEVRIKSGDEFEELADSFNIMSYQLHRQFSALETIEQIDRAILSSLKLSDIIDRTLPMIRDFFSCDLVIFGRLLDPEAYYLKGYFLPFGVGKPYIKYVNMVSSDYDRLFDNPEPVAWSGSQRFLDNVAEVKAEYYQSFLSVPLLKDDISSGLLLLAHKEPRVWDKGELSQL